MGHLQSDPHYPSRRAFVLKLRADATPDLLAGRLENLVTGRQSEFESGRELVGLLASELIPAETTSKEQGP
ncbi:hypothetical protein VAR608DRAFT_5731 [Variovorax sp. HW608]|uniref:hypothetical protein n=1 Tax=Variovorax sp. HW608 TaxID=1034889 RepID=UPI00081F7DF4|nr:hypothetical protein [Variovorax sp. HW608]SCK55567.1 hypothetical protein VAR608DRAFT_5731 [Variovorax sp. HW608]